MTSSHKNVVNIRIANLNDFASLQSNLNSLFGWSLSWQLFLSYQTTLNQSTLPVLYKHLVRTQLEYCNTVWNHGYLTDMAKSEKVQ